jgi:hypothetical protein
MLHLPTVRRLLAGGGGLVRDALRAAWVLREVEAARWVEGPSTLVARLRERGLRAEERSPAARRRLVRVIAHLDRWIMREPNCYRRALTRIALDRVSAGEPFVFGLDLRPSGPHGHAWVAGADDAGESFDVEFRL